VDEKIQQVLDKKINAAALKKNIKVRCVRTKKEGLQIEVFLKIERDANIPYSAISGLKSGIQFLLRQELCYPSLNVRFVGNNLK